MIRYAIVAKEFKTFQQDGFNPHFMDGELNTDRYIHIAAPHFLPLRLLLKSSAALRALRA